MGSNLYFSQKYLLKVVRGGTGFLACMHSLKKLCYLKTKFSKT